MYNEKSERIISVSNLDFIERFEEINDVFRHLNSNFDVNVDRYYELKSDSKDCKDKEMYGRKSIELIKEVYREDIEYFNYTFEH